MKKSDLISRIFTIIVFLIPILRYYDFIGTTISIETILSFLLVTIGCLLCIKREKNLNDNYLNKAKKSYLFFIVWLLFITVFYELFTEVNIENEYSMYTVTSLIMAIIGAIAIYIVLSGKIDFIDSIKIYEKFVWIVVILYFIQWGFYFLGMKLSFKIPFLNFSSSWEYLYNYGTFGMQTIPTSVFSERAHISQYIVPYIALCLFGDKTIVKNRIKKAVAVSIAVVSSVAGTGIVAVFIIWILYFLLFGNVKKHERIFVLLMGFFLIIAIYNILYSMPDFQIMFDKLFVDRSGNNYYTSSKADYRIYRGFDYFLQMPLLQKVFGVGYNHISTFSLMQGIYSKYDHGRITEYFAMHFQVLLYSGFVGSLAFYRQIIYLGKSKHKLIKAFIIIIFALWFVEPMLFTNYHIMYLLLIVSLNRVYLQLEVR